MSIVTAGDLIPENLGIQIRTIDAGNYQFVGAFYTIVVLQEFSVDGGGELDLEGELAVIN